MLKLDKFPIYLQETLPIMMAKTINSAITGSAKHYNLIEVIGGYAVKISADKHDGVIELHVRINDKPLFEPFIISTLDFAILKAKEWCEHIDKASKYTV